MSGRFITSSDVRREKLEWGGLAWFSSPGETSAEKLVVVEVVLQPGRGHDFHKHPQQEEVIYVLEGSVEQWIGTEKRRLQAGDSAFIDADMVHASFNVSSADAKLLAILGPCVGPGNGYESVELGSDEPWASLRS